MCRFLSSIVAWGMDICPLFCLIFDECAIRETVGRVALPTPTMPDACAGQFAAAALGCIASLLAMAAIIGSGSSEPSRAIIGAGRRGQCRPPYRCYCEKKRLKREQRKEQKEKPHRMVWFFFWQRMRDSNPRERSQSPVCYRYTNPLSILSLTQLLFISNMDYYTQHSQNVKHFFQNSRNYFFAEKGTSLRGRRPWQSPGASGSLGGDCHASVRTGSQ